MRVRRLEYGEREALVFLCGCCLCGAVGGTVATYGRILWERRHG